MGTRVFAFHKSVPSDMILFRFKAEFRFPSCPIPILYLDFRFEFKAHFVDFFPLFTITGVLFLFP
jgi:hypothetical protein